MPHYELLGPQHVRFQDDVSQHPVVQIMMNRLASGSFRSGRDDGHVVAVAIEGGGAAGAVPSGMCVALEAADLISTVDWIYGASSGALDGAFTASKQAALGATNFPDIQNSKFASKWHLLKGKSIVSLDYLFNDVMARKEPFDYDSFLLGPSFGALAVNLETNEAEVLKDFENEADLMGALRASCSMPILSGRPFIYRGVPMTDGAMRASVPFRAALDEGASHVLALRSRGETYEKYPYKRSEVAITRWFGSKALAKMLVERSGLYNDDASQLQFGGSRTVLQLAPAEREPVAQLEQSLARLRAGFQLGVNAVGQAFGMPKLRVDWNPLPIITAVTA